MHICRNHRPVIVRSTTTSLLRFGNQFDQQRTMSFQRTMGWNGTDCGQLIQLLRTMCCMGKFIQTQRQIEIVHNTAQGHQKRQHFHFFREI